MLFDYDAGKPDRIRGGIAREGDRFLFADIDTADWQRILPLLHTLRFRAGDLLVSKGADDAAFYILTAGQVAIFPEDRSTDEIARFSAPSVFGEVAFFDEAPRSAAVRALNAGNAIRVSRDAFRALTAWEPEIAHSLLMDLGRVLAARLRDTTEIMLR